jgi:hypothetical protein
MNPTNLLHDLNVSCAMALIQKKIVFSFIQFQNHLD